MRFIRKADTQSLSSGPGPGLVGQRCLLCLFLPRPVLLLLSLCLAISLEFTRVSLPFRFANSQLQLRIAFKAFLSLRTPPTTLGGSGAWSCPPVRGTELKPRPQSQTACAWVPAAPGSCVISWSLRFHICQMGLLAFPREIRIRIKSVSRSTVLRLFAGHGGGRTGWEWPGERRTWEYRRPSRCPSAASVFLLLALPSSRRTRFWFLGESWIVLRSHHILQTSKPSWRGVSVLFLHDLY